jgi:cation:H+ antiporter
MAATNFDRMSTMFFTSLPIATLLFIVSLSIVIFAAARFTQKLEVFCTMFQLSIGVLSLLSALGANIPDYISASVAIIDGHTTLGIGIILGSNIYNLTIILGLCTLFSPVGPGMSLSRQARQHVGTIAWYTLAIILSAGGMLAWLPSSPLVTMLRAEPLPHLLFPLLALLTCAIGGGLFVHILKRSHGHDERTGAYHAQVHLKTPRTIVLLSGEILLALAIVLGGIIVMVQAGQALTNDLHMPAVLAGLLVLAVATSLPNTIVAISLVRTGEVAACIEEIYIGASINTVLGVALPIMIWPSMLQDRFLLLLDSPFLLVLTLGTLFGIVKGRLTRSLGVVLLGLYVVWVIVRFWV